MTTINREQRVLSPAMINSISSLTWVSEQASATKGNVITVEVWLTLLELQKDKRNVATVCKTHSESVNICASNDPNTESLAWGWHTVKGCKWQHTYHRPWLRANTVYTNHKCNEAAQLNGTRIKCYSVNFTQKTHQGVWGDRQSKRKINKSQVAEKKYMGVWSWGLTCISTIKPRLPRTLAK